jgi:hypothetical protein
MSLTLDGTLGITFPSGSVQNNAVANNAAITALVGSRGLSNTIVPAGSVLQVVQATKTDTYSASTLGSVWNDIPGQGGSGTFQVQITPTSSTSLILIMCYIPMSFYTNNQVGRTQLRRNGTPIFIGDAASSRPVGMGQNWAASAAYGSQNAPVVMNLSGTYVDSPATTSQLTYKVVIGSDNTSGSGYAYVNMTHRDNNGAGADIRTAASMIAMEIAQ